MAVTNFIGTYSMSNSTPFKNDREAIFHLLRGSVRRPRKSVTLRPFESPYLTAREAAHYLGMTYGTFRNIATRITRTAHGRYTRTALDSFASKKKK